jgi:predicted TPR repeat methyltransferase
MEGEQRAAADAEAQAFFDDLWRDGDPWDLERSALDQQRYRRQVELLEDRRYARALEVGCGAGSFTRHLAPLCDRLVGIDIAEAAVARAREQPWAQAGGVELRVGNVMDLEPADGGPWDLVVLAETAYYLGWLYPMYDVGWLAHALHEAAAPGGRVLLVNSVEDRPQGLMSPWLVRTYRDLFVNAGFALDHEETLTGEKETVTFDVLLSRLVKQGR